MNSLPHPDDIRDTVLVHLRELCGHTVALSALVETILLSQGYYYGRAYRYGDWTATLVAESGKLTFCCDGDLLRSVDLLAPQVERHAPQVDRAPIRRAA